MASGVNRERGQLVSRGLPVCERYGLHCRFLGRAAASGVRQVCFTASDRETARMAFAITWDWWTCVDESIDPRGWRMVSCRWWTQ